MQGLLSKEPRIDISDLVAGACIVIGLLLFLVVLHSLTIQTTGDLNSLLNTVFIVFLNIFITIIIFLGIWVIARLLMWLVWSLSMPAWKKKMVQRKEMRHKQMQQQGE